MRKNKFLFENESLEERIELLENSADGVVEDTYYRKLTSSELTEKKAQFTANALKVDDLEEQKKDVLDEFKEKISPLKRRHKELGSEIRTGFEEQTGNLYKMIDLDENWVSFYSETGELIENKSRPAEMDEQQKTIQMEIRKTGTDY